MNHQKKKDVLYNIMGEIALFWAKFEYNERKKKINYQYIG